MRLAEAARGYLGIQLVRPGEDPEVQDALYHVLLAFDRLPSLDAWKASPERRQALDATQSFIEGTFHMRPTDGLAMLFRTSAPMPPPRWKVAVTWLGICPMVDLVLLAMGDRLNAWALLLSTVLFALMVVALMTWVVAPTLTRWLRPWLMA